jgi:adenylate cyclase
MRRNLPFYLIACLSLAGSLMTQFLDPPFIRDHLEGKTYDLRLHLRDLVQKQPVSPGIAIVSIDDKSISEIGRWPWSREVQARLVSAIAAGKPKVIGLDLLYSERENRGSDGKLASAMKKAANVVQATAFMVDTPGSERPPGAGPRIALQEQVTDAQSNALWDTAFMEVKSVPGIDWKRWAVKSEKVNLPLEEIARATVLGHVTSLPDMDGVLRWDILYLRYGDDCYPSFPLQLARVASGITMQKTVLYGGSGIQLGKRFIKTDLSGRVIINFRGKESSFPYISAADLMQGRVASDSLRDMIVLVGTSAMATFDQKVTPLSANFTGVEKNATVVQNILENDFIVRSPGIVEMAVIVGTGLLLIVCIPRLRARPAVALGFLLTGSYFLLTCHLLIRHNIWLNVVAPTANMTVIVVVGIIFRLFFEEKQSKQIRAMFSSYVTERLVDEMIRNPEMARLGGETREVTVLFSDIRGFTTYSENHSPEVVVSILNEYLGAMTEIVLRWEGILDKFIGDAIVVFWGAPMKQEDHAERAVHCALEMQQRIAELRRKWESEGKAPLDAGIGLNTGEVIVGNIGAEGKKMDYTVIGDHVNLGARVEGLTRRYQAAILMTEYTLEKLRPAVTRGAMRGVSMVGLERVIVKGKDTPVGIYTVTPLDDPRGAPLIVPCDPEKIVRLTEK